MRKGEKFGVCGRCWGMIHAETAPCLVPEILSEAIRFPYYVRAGFEYFFDEVALMGVADFFGLKLKATSKGDIDAK